MTRQALAQVIQRSISDPAFRSQLASDAGGALRGYDLTNDEATAVRTRDAARLTDYGIDRRMSKAFTALDPGSPGLSAVAGAEPRDIAPVWIGDYSPEAMPTHTYSGDDNAGPSEALTADDSRALGYATDEGQVTGAFQQHVDISAGDGDLQQ